MIPLADVQAAIFGAVRTLEPVEVDLRDAHGLVLAERVTAPDAVPPFPNTAMDGYAVRAADTVGAAEGSPVRLRVVGELAAGHAPTVAVHDGPPLYVDRSDDLTEKTHELGRALTGLIEGVQQLPHHQPRPGEVATWYPAHLGGHAPTRQRAAGGLDVVPFNAVIPSWGPDLDAYEVFEQTPPRDRPTR